MNETTSKTRQWELLKILTSNDPKHKNGYAIDELSKRMGVSPRTIQRDLSVMSDILKTGKIVLECRPVPGTGKQLWKIDFLSGESTVNLRYDEAIALCIGYQFLQPLIGTPIWKSASAGIKRFALSWAKTSLTNSTPWRSRRLLLTSAAAITSQTNTRPFWTTFTLPWNRSAAS